MSNPAIVLMTDPSRCSLGDVHYLLQALREMQQMGENAVPQAFCDHPAAAKGFIEAYAHAYPQLVLQDGGIPTPDHLQSLIANGQIGALGQPPELAPFGGQAPFGGARTAEQSSLSGFPIVVLTLGSSQVLIDAMQQSPAMKDSIRLVDITPEGADSQPVSIAEAVANGGLDGGDSWGAEALGGVRPELDEVAGASIRASGDLALEHDPLDLEGVDTAEAPGSATPTYDEVEVQAPATTFEAAAPAEPTAAVSAEPAVEPAATDEAYGASPAVEPVPEQANAVEAIWQGDAVPVAEATPTAESEVLQGEGVADDAPPEDAAGEDAGEDVAYEDPDYATDKGVLDDDDDVYYPPVGDLIAGSDVLYPALDQAVAQGVLQELVSVLLDDAIFDPDQAFEGLPPLPDDGVPMRSRADEPATFQSSEHVVTIEDLYGTFDQEHEDVFADSDAARPSHDTDL